MKNKKNDRPEIPLRVRIVAGRMFVGHSPFIDSLGSCYLNNAWEYGPENAQGEFIGKAIVRYEAIVSVERVTDEDIPAAIER